MVYIAHERSRDRLNWKIYELYVSHEIDACLQLIETQLYSCRGQCEFAIYIKGLILRNKGSISESLELFQASTILNPINIINLKQVGRSLYLLGRYESAIEIYDKCEEKIDNDDDWEIYYNKALCYEKLLQYNKAIDLYQNANSIQRHDSTFIRLGNIYNNYLFNYESAIEIYKEALEFSPESSILLTYLGLLYLKINDEFNAFSILGNSLTLDPTNYETILAAGSIIQNNQDYDVALIKYRVATLKTGSSSSRLWNNIAMCFYSKEKYLESTVSFRRAIYLNPFNWCIIYNLGLVYLNTKNYCSAFHQFSAAISLNKKYHLLFMYLGISLCYLNDFNNGFVAFDKSLYLLNKNKTTKDNDTKHNNNKHKNNIISDECLININYCIMLIKQININFKELYGYSKEFKFKENLSKPKSTNNNEDDEYNLFMYEEIVNNKKLAYDYWIKFTKSWKLLDSDTKNNTLCNVQKQQSILQKILDQ